MAERMLAFDPVLSQANATDWVALAQEDPAEYVARSAAVQQRQQMLTALEAERARIVGAQTSETMQRESDALLSAMPELTAPDKREKFNAELAGYLKSTFKYDDGAISAIDDHRMILIAEKARKYDALQASKASLPAKKVAPAKAVPTVKSGGAEVPRSSPRKPSANAPERDRIAWLQRNV